MIAFHMSSSVFFRKNIARGGETGFKGHYNFQEGANIGSGQLFVKFLIGGQQMLQISM